MSAHGKCRAVPPFPCLGSWLQNRPHWTAQPKHLAFISTLALCRNLAQGHSLHSVEGAQLPPKLFGATISLFILAAHLVQEFGAAPQRSAGPCLRGRGCKVAGIVGPTDCSVPSVIQHAFQPPASCPQSSQYPPPPSCRLFDRRRPLLWFTFWARLADWKASSTSALVHAAE